MEIECLAVCITSRCRRGLGAGNPFLSLLPKSPVACLASAKVLVRRKEPSRLCAAAQKDVTTVGHSWESDVVVAQGW